MVAMKRLRVLGPCLVTVLAFSMSLLAGCQKSAGSPPAETNAANDSAANPFEPTQAQPKLPTVKLYVGSEQMDAELCVTPLQTETGMMFRKSMGTNDGMLFNLNYLGATGGTAAFWMKNCFVPLSVAYINPEGVIEEIHPLQVQDTNNVVSTARNIRFALETPQGWFDQHHIAPGMVIRTERGTLLQTFGNK